MARRLCIILDSWEAVCRARATTSDRVLATVPCDLEDRNQYLRQARKMQMRSARQTQDDAQAAIHMVDEKAEVLDIELRLTTLPNMSRARGSF